MCGYLWVSLALALQSPSESMYGGRHTVTLIPGDGIGPELAACVKEVFRYMYVYTCMLCI